MKRNYSLSLFRIALVLVTGCAFLLPGSARAQTRTFPDLLGHYRGFFQSIGDPNVRGPVELNINFAEPPEPEFSGVLTMGSMLPFNFSGKVDANGTFKFRGSGPAGSVAGTGKWQDLTRGGALVLATYKFTPTVGPIAQGKVDLLRGFQDPPEPEMPPDIAGSWRGTFESGLSLMTGADEWMVQQDRTKTGTPSTGFMGQETVDLGAAGMIMYDFVGTIDGQGNAVRIDLSERGIIVICFAKVERGELQAHPVWNFFDGGMDLGSIALTQQANTAP